MESKTKVKLSRAVIQRLVHHAFGELELVNVRELTDGWFNTAYRITMGGKQRHTVLKVGPPAEAEILTYEKNLLRAEVEAMNLVATNPQVPVPDISFDDFTRTQLPYEYYFMDFIEGKTWDKIRPTLTEKQNNSIEYQLDQITARINAFEHTAFGYYAYGREFERWTDAFRWMCELLFDDASRYQITLELSEREFFGWFDEHQAIFAEITRPLLVHWDLWAGNIFITFDEDEPRIAGIVDFERALWGDPLMESYPGRLVGIPNYIAGYGKDILAAPTLRLRRIFYNIYLDLVMIIEDDLRQYDDKRSVRWAQECLRQDINMLRHGDVIKLPNNQN